MVFIAAVACAVACIEAFADGVNYEGAVEDGEVGFDSAVIQAQDTLDGKAFENVGAPVLVKENGKYLRKVVNANANSGVVRSSDGKPYLVRKERSALGREIDGIKRVAATRMEVGMAFNAQYAQITNLMERVRVLEEAERERKERSERMRASAKERAEMRKAASTADARKTIDNLKARSRRLEGRKRPPVGVTKEEINSKVGGAK